ncbi:hypothetical protein VNI00_011523 [Paramarasmius palmivorus]|uniref:Uncharacterized protein n=1 Tax=Paramarasmius palmivorus TaxID=297713 RepID=A0AAW0CCY0_9AGAR
MESVPSIGGSNSPASGTPKLVGDVLLGVLSSILLEARDEGRFTVDLLLIEPDLYWDLLKVLYRKIRITRGSTIRRLRVAFVENPELPTLVRELRIQVVSPPLVEFQYTDVFGSSFDLPEILVAVAPFVEHLAIQCRMHPDILLAFRTTSFPKVVVLEAPHYLLMDAHRSIRLHARLRSCFRSRGIDLDGGGRIRRLNATSISDEWPALRRLCIRCKWGLPPLEVPLFDFTHFVGVKQVSVVLTDRTWEANIAHFLAHIRPPPNADAIALVLCNRHYVRHSLFAHHTYHPKMVVPVFGDPEQFTYCGDPDFAYLCDLVCVVNAEPARQAFWDRVQDYVRRRQLSPEVFHSDLDRLMRFK